MIGYLLIYLAVGLTLAIQYEIRFRLKNKDSGLEWWIKIEFYTVVVLFWPLSLDFIFTVKKY